MSERTVQWYYDAWQLAAGADYCTPAEQLSPGDDDPLLKFDKGSTEHRELWRKFYRQARASAVADQEPPAEVRDSPHNHGGGHRGPLPAGMTLSRARTAISKITGLEPEAAEKQSEVKLAAIKDALDRAGLKPPAEVVLSQGETKPYEELFDDISSGSRAESRRARGVPDIANEFAGFSAEEYDTPSPPAMAAETHSQPDPPREPRPREAGRERGAQRAERHITGEAAMRAANEANRQIGALKAIEGPHKRYPRP